MNTKICTSIEQSKKLLSLGLDPSTADMCYVIDYSAYDRIGKDKYNIQVDHYGCLIHQQDNIPAWSLSALLELMPAIIRNCQLTIDKEEDEAYNISYDGIFSRESVILYAEYSLIDAAFEMVCWLIEQGHIKVNK